MPKQSINPHKEIVYKKSKPAIIDLMPGEHWWGGFSMDGHLMPYDSSTKLTRNLYGENKGNQASPFLVSSKGRYVWSNKPYQYTFENGVLTIDKAHCDVHVGAGGENLSDGFNTAAKKFFPASGEPPDRLLFTAPQYNTWIELIYNQNEKDIRAYGEAIICRTSI